MKNTDEYDMDSGLCRLNSIMVSVNMALMLAAENELEGIFLNDDCTRIQLDWGYVLDMNARGEIKAPLMEYLLNVVLENYTNLDYVIFNLSEN